MDWVATRSWDRSFSGCEAILHILREVTYNFIFIDSDIVERNVATLNLSFDGEVDSRIPLRAPSPTQIGKLKGRALDEFCDFPSTNYCIIQSINHRDGRR